MQAKRSSETTEDAARAAARRARFVSAEATASPPRLVSRVDKAAERAALCSADGIEALLARALQDLAIAERRRQAALAGDATAALENVFNGALASFRALREAITAAGDEQPSVRHLRAYELAADVALVGDAGDEYLKCLSRLAHFYYPALATRRGAETDRECALESPTALFLPGDAQRHFLDDGEASRYRCEMLACLILYYAHGVLNARAAGVATESPAEDAIREQLAALDDDDLRSPSIRVTLDVLRALISGNFVRVHRRLAALPPRLVLVVRRLLPSLRRWTVRVLAASSPILPATYVASCLDVPVADLPHWCGDVADEINGERVAFRRGPAMAAR